MSSPFPYNKLEEPNDELLSQEVITYVKRNKDILKITVKRNFFGKDYIDNTSTQVIYSDHINVQ